MGGNKKIKQVRPHARLREKIARAEGRHMQQQDRAFGGDAVSAKYDELLKMYPGLKNMSEEEVDSLVSAYYNSTIKGFKKRFDTLIKNHISNPSLVTFDALNDAIATRWKDSPKQYQNGIRNRNAWESEMFNASRGRYIDENKAPVLLDLYYRQYVQNQPQNLQTETPLYDSRAAYKANMSPSLEDDGFYHMPSRNPDTGQYLKSAAHPTTLKAAVEDYLMGYQPQIVNGKLGSQFEPVLNNIQRPFLIVQPQYTYPIINNE